MKHKTLTTWAQLKDRLFQSKRRSKERTIKHRRDKEKVKYYQQVAIQLRAELAEYKARQSPVQVFNCVYPAQMMALAVFIVLHGGSLRCAAAAAGFYAQLMGWKYKAPVHKTVSNWVERCGLHALNLSKTIKGEYVAIIDASIEIGKEQLLLLLGLPKEQAVALDRPLTMQDVQVLNMEVQSSWKGDEVKEFIERTQAERRGLSFSYFITDQGANLLAALRKLAIPQVKDCSHVLMNVVKKLFKDDEQLNALYTTVSQLRQTWLLTQWSFLLPPTFRLKDRFSRIFILVDWMDRIDQLSSNLPKTVRDKLRKGRSRWLDLRLRQVHELLTITTKILKYDGLSQLTYLKWKSQVDDFMDSQTQVTQQAKDFVQKMTNYFEEHSPMYPHWAKVQCCSDIIESTFGRYKNKGGMKTISTDVLAIPLYNIQITTDFIVEAMRNVKTKQVDEWRCLYVCHNKYGIRKQRENHLKSQGSG